ncbi:dipeptide ABC transporter ATP-binding protein [Bordetella genomosp. 13]|uniref:dipeptide ABC transporter ATP-binding protein n=1 Tax=Bordetella genomosp. 13 TaxID=463040 RepID=UPI0011AABAEE|nr:ABC transporter ATP-binding protein [Bordetella genomosp. 13]
MSAPGRPKGEYRSAQHDGTPVNPPGRPKREYRSAQHDGTPAVDTAHEHPAAPLLEVSRLRVAFGQGASERPVVKGVSFTVAPGRCLAIVGESGSGKSVTARSLVGLAGHGARVQADALALHGEDLRGHDDARWRRLRGARIGFVLQDALVSLDPLRRVGQEIGEGPRLHGLARTRAERDAKAIELLRQVGVPEPELKIRQLPHELSGGQRQRALIASALALDPALLVADEPTTALDVTIQAQILDLLNETRARGKGLILISHDLAVVSRMADEVLVMRHGEVVERGPAGQIFRDPRHDYTRRLLAAVPSAHSRGARLAEAGAPRLARTEPLLARDAAVPAQEAATPLLHAQGLVKRFTGPDKVTRTVVRDVSFTLHAGQTLGVVGESGSGKSTLARMVLALETPSEGHVLMNGLPWTALSENQRRPTRRDISVIYQDPLSSFDPRWTVERIIEDSLPHEEGGTGSYRTARRRARVGELLDLAGLPASYRARRPLELSGGQRQRVAIARAIAPRPRIIVCDEPVSALDVSIQAQVLDLLLDLKTQLGVSYLFISHDLGVVHHVSDRVLVMSNGRVVEQGDVDDVFLRPSDPYTRRLVAAIPRLRRAA